LADCCTGLLLCWRDDSGGLCGHEAWCFHKSHLRKNPKQNSQGRKSWTFFFVSSCPGLLTVINSPSPVSSVSCCGGNHPGDEASSILLSARTSFFYVPRPTQLLPLPCALIVSRCLPILAHNSPQYVHACLLSYTRELFLVFFVTFTWAAKE
jgi:hypothetical protein